MQRLQNPLVINYERLPMISIRKRHNIHPRDMTFIKLIIGSICPDIGFTSVITLLSLCQIIIFIITVCCSSRLGDKFLQPDQYTLQKFGCKYPYLQRYNYQIWRFICPIFLHSDFLHIVNNLFSQLFIGSSFEYYMGRSRFFVQYILSGIGGFLFSSIMSNARGVGASGAFMGVVAGLLVFLMINWTYLQQYGQYRSMMLCFVMILVLMNLAVGGDVDVWGHLGGFLSGLSVSLMLQNRLDKGPVKSYRNVGYIVSFTYFVGGLILFYTACKPSM